MSGLGTHRESENRTHCQRAEAGFLTHAFQGPTKPSQLPELLTWTVEKWFCARTGSTDRAGATVAVFLRGYWVVLISFKS